MLMFMKASDDYLAARCLIMNALFSGFTLASQAVEKLLRALIYLETGKKIKNKEIFHDPFQLKEVIRIDSPKFDKTLKKLADHYSSRYHDGKIKYDTNGASTEELDDIDNIWVFLIKKLPLPNEVKFRSAFFGYLFEGNAKLLFGRWAILNNKALEKDLVYFEKKYKEVENYLYKN